MEASMTASFIPFVASGHDVSVHRHATLLSQPFQSRLEPLTLEQAYFLLCHIRSQIPMPVRTSQLKSPPTVGSVLIIRVTTPDAQDHDGYVWKCAPLSRLVEMHTTMPRTIEVLEDGNGWKMGDLDAPCLSRIRYRLPGSPSNQIQVVHYLPPLSDDSKFMPRAESGTAASTTFTLTLPPTLVGLCKEPQSVVSVTATATASTLSSSGSTQPPSLASNKPNKNPAPPTLVESEDCFSMDAFKKENLRFYFELVSCLSK